MAPKRKTPRHERREKRAVSGDVSPSPVPERTSEPPPARDISYTGLAGAFMGAAFFAATAVAVLVDPGDASRLLAVLYAFIAVCFVPALAVSAFSTPRRSTVLKVTVMACVLLAIGTLYFDPGYALALAPSTALLAIAAGFVFQGRSAKTK